MRDTDRNTQTDGETDTNRWRDRHRLRDTDRKIKIPEIFCLFKPKKEKIKTQADIPLRFFFSPFFGCVCVSF